MLHRPAAIEKQSTAHAVLTFSWTFSCDSHSVRSLGTAEKDYLSFRLKSLAIPRGSFGYSPVIAAAAAAANGASDRSGLTIDISRIAYTLFRKRARSSEPLTSRAAEIEMSYLRGWGAVAAGSAGQKSLWGTDGINGDSRAKISAFTARRAVPRGWSRGMNPKAG